MSGSIRHTIRSGLSGDNIDEFLELLGEQIQDSRNINIQVVWLQDYDYFVTSGGFYLNGARKNIVGAVVTLNNGDATHPRRDVIVAQADGTPGVVEGTPAANPVLPEIDPAIQIVLTDQTVPALSTAPPDISNVIAYDENDDWTYADSGATINPDAVADPFAGTKHIAITNGVNGNFFTLTDSVDHAADEFERLTMRHKNVAYSTNQNRYIRYALYNLSGARVSDWVPIRNNSYGFSASNTAEHQLVSIPMADFNLKGASWRTLRGELSINNASSLSFGLDNIIFQVGGVIVNGDFATVEYVDAAVLNKPETIVLACSDENSDLAVGTGVCVFRMPYGFELTAVRASVKTAPTGSTKLTVDINAGGVSILSTKLTFDASEKTTTTAAVPAVLSTTSLNDDQEITVDIDAVGSTVKGTGLKVYLIGKQR